MKNLSASSVLSSLEVRRFREEASSVQLVVACPRSSPDVWSVYCEALAACYAEIGAGHLAPSTALPIVETRVLLAKRGDQVIGGIRVREGTDIHEYPGLEMLRGVLDARAVQGLNEVKGIWVDSSERGRGVSAQLISAALEIAAEWGDRWSVALVNPLSKRASEKEGWEVDPRFENLPFPTRELASSLLWFDHGAQEHGRWL